MKYLALALLLVAPASAMACPHSRTQFICPGDEIVDAGNHSGTVIAVNPFTHMVSYSSQDFYTNQSALATSVALASGCLEAVCVGDEIVDAGNHSGTVIAVNPNTRMVAYSSQDFYTNQSALVTSLKVGYGCALGYCVGDEIVDAGNHAGTIIAISPYNDTAAYSSQDFYTNQSARIESLSSTQYCTQYNADHPARLAQHYPAMPLKRYAAPDFPYYSHR